MMRFGGISGFGLATNEIGSNLGCFTLILSPVTPKIVDFPKSEVFGWFRFGFGGDLGF